MTAKTLPDASSRVDTLFDLLTPVLALPGGSGAAGAGSTAARMAPDPAGSYWLAFTRDHNEDKAAAAFALRYGRPPRHVMDGLGGLLLAGPVPELQGEVLL